MDMTIKTVHNPEHNLALLIYSPLLLYIDPGRVFNLIVKRM